MKYERASFRFRVGKVAYVEVHLQGCKDERTTIPVSDMDDAARVLSMLAKAIQGVQRRLMRVTLATVTSQPEPP